MLPDDGSWRPFVILLATESEINGRAWRSVLESSGYAVIAADSAAKAIELTRRQAPDLVVLDTTFSDRSGIDICRELGGDPDFDLSTPIILIATHGISRAQRLEAYGSGAWEVCSHPLDGSALLLKLQIFLRAKQAVDRARDSNLVDGPTGLYNTNGLRRRTREIAADAARHSEPLACVAFTPMRADHPEEELDAGTVFRVAERCRRLARGSDVLGRIGKREFALIAPATDAGGAMRMIDRLERELADGAPDDGDERSIRLRAGYCATPNFAEFSLGAMDMLLRASAALHDSRGPRAQARLDDQEPPPAAGGS